jgi:hypothetical protein
MSDDGVPASSRSVQALQRANHVRRARSLLKRRVANGELALAEVILTCPPDIATMPIAQLLASQHGWGEARSRALLARVTLREDKSVGSLTDRQRQAVASLLTPNDPPPTGRGRLRPPLKARPRPARSAGQHPTSRPQNLSALADGSGSPQGDHQQPRVAAGLG